VDDGKQGMENALKANHQDVLEHQEGKRLFTTLDQQACGWVVRKLA
jgi:hypothetical protein